MLFKFLRNKKNRETIVIVGTQETNLDRGHISWNSPIAKAVMKKKSGDTIEVITPAGLQEIKILSVSYKVIEN